MQPQKVALYYVMSLWDFSKHKKEGKKAVEHISIGLRCGKYNMMMRYSVAADNCN